MKTIFLTVGITLLVCYLLYELLMIAISANNGIIGNGNLVDYKKSLENLTINSSIRNVLQNLTGGEDKYIVVSDWPSLLISYSIFTEKGMFGIFRWSKAHKITRAKFDEMYNIKE